MSKIVTYDRLGNETDDLLTGTVLSSIPVNGGPLYLAEVRLQNGVVTHVLIKPEPVAQAAE